MRADASRMNIVRKDEKEAKLTQFVERYLAALRATSTHQPLMVQAPVCHVVARCPESPVTKVILGFMPQFSVLGVSIKALYAMPGPASPFQTHPCEGPPPRVDLRRAGDVRLLEAHELLILGPRTAWVGDCMRREPAKGDAYEFYADDCHEMAAAALRSFDRLWAIAKPFRPRLVASNPMPMPRPTPAQVLAPSAEFPVSFSRH